MIPSIHEILVMLGEQQCTADQAFAWLNAHVDAAEERGSLAERREALAAMAMQGLVSEMGSTARADPEVCARMAVEHADALLEALK